MSDFNVSPLEAATKQRYSSDITVVTSMAMQLGQLPEFDLATSKIGAHLVRVDLYFAANDTASEKKVPIFLNAIAGKT